MGDWLTWLVLGVMVVVLFCIYSLSSQLERCVQLAVEIVTGNQRKMMEQLEALAAARASQPQSTNVVTLERRTRQRRRSDEETGAGFSDRRRMPGRRRDDVALARVRH
jgi:uncharacterized membrane protein affecting hemolysin expression